MDIDDIERTLVRAWPNIPSGVELTLPRGVFGLKEPITITKPQTAMQRMCEEWVELRKIHDRE